MRDRFIIYFFYCALCVCVFVCVSVCVCVYVCVCVCVCTIIVCFQCAGKKCRYKSVFQLVYNCL